MPVRDPCANRRADRMMTLFHHPMCPHSRFVRLLLGEYGVEVRQVREQVWERREEFLILNPAGTVPVLIVTEGLPPVPGGAIIAEYLDESLGSELGDQRMLPHDPYPRVEVRRLMSWFNDKFFAEVSGPLTTEQYKRYLPLGAGGGSPDPRVISAAHHNVRYHLAYIGMLVRECDWLAGNRLTYADLAAAAHLSAAEDLGGIPWSEDNVVKAWYSRVQSRPSFRSLNAQGWRGFARR